MPTLPVAKLQSSHFPSEEVRMLKICIFCAFAVLSSFSSAEQLNGIRRDDITYKPYPGDCNRYYQTRALNCPTKSYWNAQLQRCDTNALSNCSKFPSQREEDFNGLCKDKQGTFIPYPGDCTRFIQCDYLPFVKSCPRYLYWNSQLLTCDKICV
ncbi:hypothetical protein AWZ03_005954 [Drosophila navojoa]|uniref:Chitin-binding type-2 domain-containing protein n=1 Tax=Drosophila navojoa TaxID=7232 RepID=A0A484BFM1_DRONA|nr:hypothetical protein AWZ03_005954 [Drosophila navojoa]